jgi:DNA-binding XRE family transcriptional regulator
MKPRAKKQRQQTGRDRWNLTPQGIAATNLDDFDDLDDPGGLPPFLLAMACEDLDAACAKAAWGRRPTSAAAQSGSPGSDTRTDPPRSSPPIARNTPPPSVWEALRRLLGCNKQELAARLGVSRHTLQRWERDELPEAAAARVAALMQETLGAAGAGWTVAPLFRPEAFQRSQTGQSTG